MALWLKIVVAIIIWFVAALVGAAIFQTIGFMENSGPTIVGMIAAGIFFFTTPTKSKS